MILLVLVPLGPLDNPTSRPAAGFGPLGLALASRPISYQLSGEICDCRSKIQEAQDPFSVDRKLRLHRPGHGLLMFMAVAVAVIEKSCYCPR